MKKRVSRVINFFAFNLLFFALYLNFIHKDSSAQEALPKTTSSATVKGTSLVENPEHYLNKQTANSSPVGSPTKADAQKTVALN
jgi:hypothetical protein